MAVGGPTLLCAGTPDALDPNEPWAAYEGKRGGVLYSVATSDGAKQDELRLEAAPVYDGLAVAGGRLYLVWQTARNGNTDIYLKTHDGVGWSDALLVSNSPANDWEPTVAVSPTGKVAIAWDSYASGDYDIFLRFLTTSRIELDGSRSISASYCSKPQDRSMLRDTSTETADCGGAWCSTR